VKIKVDWDDPAQTIVRWEFPSEWTWDDVEEARQQSVAMRRSVSHRVAVILDMLGSQQSLPRAPLKMFAKGMREFSEGRDVTVLVTKNKLIHNTVEIFTTLPSGKKYAVRSALTLDDAYGVIQLYRMQKQSS